MKLDEFWLVCAVSVCAVLVVVGVIYIANVTETPENAQIRQNERSRTNVMRLENLINEFTYTKDKNTGVCYAMYPNIIKSLTSVPCSDKVLETIRKQRMGNDR